MSIAGILYHTRGLDIRSADLLYEVGFREINGPNDAGYTPVRGIIKCTESQLELLPWFAAKGPNFCKPLTGWSSIPLRYAANGIGRCLRRLATTALEAGTLDESITTSHVANAINFILTNSPQETGDHCRCYCSSAGCPTLVMILKVIPLQTWPLRTYYQTIFMLLDWISNNCTADLPTIGQIYHAIFHYLLFERYELTHTCCQPVRDSFDLDCSGIGGNGIQRPIEIKEVTEIWDEEQEIIYRFYRLCDEGFEDYKASTLSFVDFVKQFLRLHCGEMEMDLADIPE